MYEATFDVSLPQHLVGLSLDRRPQLSRKSRSGPSSNRPLVRLRMSGEFSDFLKKEQKMDGNKTSGSKCEKDCSET